MGHPRMRQFLGLWWDEDSLADAHACPREVLIFDSSSRRRAFQQALRLVEREGRQKKSAVRDGQDSAREAPPVFLGRRGIPERTMRKEVIGSLQKTCHRKGVVEIMNATFVKKSSRGTTTSGWSDALSNQRGGDAQPELLIMSQDVIAAVSLAAFLKEYARRDDQLHYLSDAEAVPNNDDDEDYRARRDQRRKVGNGPERPVEDTDSSDDEDEDDRFTLRSRNAGFNQDDPMVANLQKM